MMDSNYLLVSGVVCLAGAIVGGNFKLSGVEIPLLNSKPKQILLALLGLALLSTKAYSTIRDYSNHNRCEQYANVAIDQFQEKVTLGCKMTGERWHDNFASHHGWCLTQSSSSAKSEVNIRNTELESCGNKISKQFGKAKFKG